MNNLKSEVKMLRSIIADKENAMQLQIEEDVKLRQQLNIVKKWFSKHTGIAPASLNSHMRSMDRTIDELGITIDELKNNQHESCNTTN